MEVTFLYKPGSSLLYEEGLRPHKLLLGAFEYIDEIVREEFPTDNPPTLLYVKDCQSLEYVSLYGLNYLLIDNPMIGQHVLDLLDDMIMTRCRTGGILFISKEIYREYQEKEDVDTICITDTWNDGHIQEQRFYSGFDSLFSVSVRETYITLCKFFPVSKIEYYGPDRYEIKEGYIIIDGVSYLEILDNMTESSIYPPNSIVVGVAPGTMEWSITSVGNSLTCQFNGVIYNGHILRDNVITVCFGQNTLSAEYRDKSLYWDNSTVWLVSRIDPLVFDFQTTEIDSKCKFGEKLSRMISGDAMIRNVYHPRLLELSSILTSLSHIEDMSTFLGNLNDISKELADISGANLPRATIFENIQ